MNLTISSLGWLDHSVFFFFVFFSFPRFRSEHVVYIYIASYIILNRELFIISSLSRNILNCQRTKDAGGRVAEVWRGVFRKKTTSIARQNSGQTCKNIFICCGIHVLERVSSSRFSSYMLQNIFFFFLLYGIYDNVNLVYIYTKNRALNWLALPFFFFFLVGETLYRLLVMRCRSDFSFTWKFLSVVF